MYKVFFLCILPAFVSFIFLVIIILTRMNFSHSLWCLLKYRNVKFCLSSLHIFPLWFVLFVPNLKSRSSLMVRFPLIVLEVELFHLGLSSIFSYFLHMKWEFQLSVWLLQHHLLKRLFLLALLLISWSECDEFCLDSEPLITMPVLHCLEYCNFVVDLKSGRVVLCFCSLSRLH